MKKLLILLSLCFVFYTNAQQTTTCSCCTEQHKQFNFWLGEWDVYDTTGKKVGENKIASIQNGCVLQENWVSNSMTGTSNNYYNSTDSTWNQVWVDNTGSSLVLKGNFKNGVMNLKSELLKGKKVAWYYNRITWTKNKDGSVTQTWDILDNNDKLLSCAFKGIYKLKPKAAKAKMPNDKQTN